MAPRAASVLRRSRLRPLRFCQGFRGCGQPRGGGSTQKSRKGVIRPPQLPEIKQIPHHVASMLRGGQSSVCRSITLGFLNYFSVVIGSSTKPVSQTLTVQMTCPPPGPQGPWRSWRLFWRTLHVLEARAGLAFLTGGRPCQARARQRRGPREGKEQKATGRLRCHSRKMLRVPAIKAGGAHRPGREEAASWQPAGEARQGAPDRARLAFRGHWSATLVSCRLRVGTCGLFLGEKGSPCSRPRRRQEDRWGAGARA